MGTDAYTKMGPEYSADPACEGHDIPFLAILSVGIAGVNGVLRVYAAPGGAPLLLSKEFLRDLGCHIDLGRGHLFFEKLGVRTVVASKQSPHLLLPLRTEQNTFVDRLNI